MPKMPLSYVLCGIIVVLFHNEHAASVKIGDYYDTVHVQGRGQPANFNISSSVSN